MTYNIKHMIERQISQKVLLEGKFMNFVEDQIEIDIPGSDDKHRGYRQYFIHPGGVVIIPVNDKGELVLVKQFRTPIGETIYEFPAGKKEKDEEPLITAKRELAEETGYKAKTWIDLGEIYPCPGYATEVLHMYLAKDLESGESNPDEGEFVEPVLLSLAELESMIVQGNLKDAKTIAGLMLAKTYIR